RLEHARVHRGAEEGEGDLVPLPPVRRAAGAADGAGERRGASRSPRGGDHPVVRGDAGALADGAADAEVLVQRRAGRTGRHSGTGRQRNPALLHDGRSQGGPRRVQGEAEAELREIPAAAVMQRAVQASPVVVPAPEGDGGHHRDGVPSTSLRIWSLAARPRTLTAAVAPVLVGTAAAAAYGAMRPLPALAALLAAVCIQIGTNFANDYHDFQRGADTHDRLGPRRVT